MEIIIVIIVGAFFGFVQFLLRRRTLKPLAEGNPPQVGIMFFLKMAVPLVLLISCALIDTAFLPYTAASFCLSSIVATIANHLITNKKKDIL